MSAAPSVAPFVTPPPEGWAASPAAVQSPVSGLRLAPDFDLSDHIGGTFHLASELAKLRDVGGGGAVVAVFFRGHWCPYCRRYLSKLQEHLPRLKAAGARLVAISPEPTTTSHALAAELGLAFPILSDADGGVINRYGTRNGFLGGGSVLPHPSVFVIDPAGAIRFHSIDRNFKKRTTIRSLLAALADVAPGAGQPR